MVVGICSNPTHVEFCGEEIDDCTFGYKGCWNCHFFELDFEKFMYVHIAAYQYDVSESTIRRWCRIGKINAEKYETKRFFNGPPKIWLISNDDS